MLTVKAKAGRIDVLFVNAGFYEFGKFGEITEEHFDKTFNTNVRGLLFAVQRIQHAACQRCICQASLGRYGLTPRSSAEVSGSGHVRRH